MNKTDLVNEIAAKANLSKVAAKAALDAYAGINRAGSRQ